MNQQTTVLHNRFITVTVEAEVSRVMPGLGSIPPWFDARRVVDAASKELDRQWAEAKKEGWQS